MEKMPNQVNLPMRDIKFDILRLVGLLCIILAHTNPPSILFQMRNFDVPLMVIISGAVFGLSTSNQELSYESYLKKRIPRLLAPTWVFLILFFIVTYILFSISGNEYPFSEKSIVSSFALISGIGYVWIIRVFILMAIIAPLLLKIHNLLDSNAKYFIAVFIFYVIYELIFHIYRNTGIYVLDIIINNFFFYIVPYGFLFSLGLRLPTLDKKSILIISYIFLSLFIGLLFFNYSSHFVSTQLYKYPPRLYYLSYAIFVSLNLYLLSNSQKLSNIFKSNFLLFMSSSSMWIYLWHILFVYCWNWTVPFRPAWTNNFMIMFCFVVVLATTATKIQKHFISKLTFSPKISQKTIKLLSIIFLK